MAFNIHLLRGEDPQAQFDAITEKDPNTLYLLQSGKGYLGDFMLFNADSSIDFSDLQQVKDKLTYVETDDEGDHTYSTIIGYCENEGTTKYAINPMNLMPDNGIGVLTDETHRIINPEMGTQLDTLYEAVLEPDGEFENNTYQQYPFLLNTVPTLNFLMCYVRDYVNKRLDPYVTHSIDDGTVTE